ncbi:hypothetical protein K438DRAFT_1780592 [Mycena galopus ATCC 62051]|nr:hypothetical protein K438DRAFT_1780592 [Mycena galopus ATCC 62051]
MSSDKPISAYKASAEVQKQQGHNQSGLDKDMAIPAEHSKVEDEHVGSERLKEKKDIITNSGIGRTATSFIPHEGRRIVTTVKETTRVEGGGGKVEVEHTHR